MVRRKKTYLGFGFKCLLSIQLVLNILIIIRILAMEEKILEILKNSSDELLTYTGSNMLVDDKLTHLD